MPLFKAIALCLSDASGQLIRQYIDEKSLQATPKITTMYRITACVIFHSFYNNSGNNLPLNSAKLFGFKILNQKNVTC